MMSKAGSEQLQFQDDLLKVIRAVLGKFTFKKYIEKNQISCRCNGCKNKPIRSHSQSINHLSKIAICRKIYTLSPSLLKRAKEPFELINIKSATTFPGYCPTHDSAIFKTLDNLKSTDRFNVSLAHAILTRAVNYEYHRKQYGAHLYKKLIAAIAEIDDSIYKNNVLEQFNALKYGCELFTRSDYKNYREKLKDQKNIKYYGCYTNETPPVSISTLINPLFDQHTPSGNQPMMAFDVIPLTVGSLIIFTWHNDYDDSLTNLKKYFTESNIVHFTNILCFLESENICISPAFYQSLKEESKIQMWQFITTSHLQAKMALWENFPNFITFQPTTFIRNDTTV